MKRLKQIFLFSVSVTLFSGGLMAFSPEKIMVSATTLKQISEKKQFGIIQGIITDETGAVIGGATVIARHLTDNVEIQTITGEDGTYTISNLKPGQYEVRVQAAGFCVSLLDNIQVSLSVNTKINLTLKVASASEIVTITGGEVLVERDTSQISANYDARRVVDLPAVTKSKSKKNKVIALNPGVFSPKSSNPSAIINKPVPIEGNSEGYKNYGVNPWTKTKNDSFSTFAVDVDTGSYTIARRKLNENTLPPVDSVRVEEFINYFKYNYPNPATKHPFSLTMEAASSPFDETHHFLRIGLKGREIAPQKRSAAHLTFLVDTSGSMQSEDKIGLVKKSLKMLINHLQPQDTVAITTYAGEVSLVLPPTHITEKAVILNAIDELQSGGGTAMEAGIDLAYKQAFVALQPNGINRVIICSDGDANIGNTSHEEILKQIEGYVEQGITVSTIGFGMGNYKDTMMEQFANKGNGNYYYVDGISQARRIFVEQLTGTLQVIAKDVKVQVEFNPAAVLEYRLIGYENRDIADKDFRNDQVDAGEIGAGHTVTAVYEIKLQKRPVKNLAIVRLRYKKPNANKLTSAQEVAANLDLSKIQQNFSEASEDFRFSIAVSAFAENLRDSQAAKNWSLEKIISIAELALQPDNKERQEFFQLAKKAQQLKLIPPQNPKP